MTDLNHARRLLESQLAELQERRTHLDRDLSETPDADSGERAVQVEDDEALEGQAALVSAEITSVTRALDRIAAGTYGACTACGEQIAPGRLEARPEGALCIACASVKG